MDIQNKYNEYFKYILAFSALFIAGNAAFFSITGLSHLFSGAFWSVVIMASSLELGKLVSASFLYRYWDKISNFMKTYLLVGTIILVGITSIGIFGYLSKAYQESAVDLERITTKMELYEDEVLRLTEDKKFMLEEMEAQISSLPDNYITAKRKIREEYMPTIRDMSVKITESKSELGNLKQEFINTGVDVGPILYVAKMLQSDVDSVVRWLIIILIVVFDPLAVALVVAANIVLNDNKEIFTGEEQEESKEEEELRDVAKHPEPLPVKEDEPEEEVEVPQKEEPVKVKEDKPRKKFLPY